MTIEDLLDKKLPQAYETALFEQKCELVYNHVYEKYYGVNQSVYARALAV